jgi:antitoxin component of RelBE/YafQ-DinJ toxin-antitoxin module
MQSELSPKTTQLVTAQIAFRYRAQDSATGVTRQTAKRLAEVMGVDETQVIHMALQQMASQYLPQYEADDGPLTAAQLRQVQKSALKPKGGTVRSHLFDSVKG